MISYMIDGQGFLIVNRQVVGEDIASFEYCPPKLDLNGEFTVFNEKDEMATLQKFFHHMQVGPLFFFLPLVSPISLSVLVSTTCAFIIVCL